MSLKQGELSQQRPMGDPSHATTGTTLARHELPYPGIDDYAVIGDCRTAALISRNASIDWLCLPHFSGPAIFAAILDRHRGGCFSITPARHFTSHRHYVHNTNVLVTTFETDEGLVRITDCLPIIESGSGQQSLQVQRELLRVVEVIEGETQLDVMFDPRPDYGRRRLRFHKRGALGWAAQFGNEIVFLHTDTRLQAEDGATLLKGRCKLKQGDKAYFSLAYTKGDIAVIPHLGVAAEERLESTIRWWRSWHNHCAYKGAYQAVVARSLLTLKLMTYTLSGAVIAAPTASLPEDIGGERNWDYRFCWLRDASLTLRSFLDVGYTAEGECFFDWLMHSTRLTWPRLQVLYDVYGETRIPERTLGHLNGYRDSRPVRIGNAAWNQLQLDIYGAVVVAAYDHVVRGGRLDRSKQRMLTGLGTSVCHLWRHPDQGIWEMRNGRRHHTYSKLMCWVALDRLIKLHNEGHIKIKADWFEQERNAIRAAIEEHGFNAELNAYTGEFGGDEADAALLLMPRLGYIDALDPRMKSTFAFIDKELGHGALVFRYKPHYDQLSGTEGAFGICSFWAVDYLARAGDTDGAKRRFERLLAYANDLGLYGEEIDPDSGQALGNFPQAFTHVGLIAAALSIDEAERRGRTET